MIAGQMHKSGYPVVLPSFELLAMVGRIACIIFSIEILIMAMLTVWDLRELGVMIDVLDPTILTVLASPIIYVLVARPFAEAAREANAKLKRQLEETQRLLEQNERLRSSLQEASESSADMHEKMLQKIGAELHDGPAQLLTYTLF